MRVMFHRGMNPDPQLESLWILSLWKSNSFQLIKIYIQQGQISRPTGTILTILSLIKLRFNLTFDESRRKLILSRGWSIIVIFVKKYICCRYFTPKARGADDQFIMCFRPIHAPALILFVAEWRLADESRPFLFIYSYVLTRDSVRIIVFNFKLLEWSFWNPKSRAFSWLRNPSVLKMESRSSLSEGNSDSISLGENPPGFSGPKNNLLDPIRVFVIRALTSFSSLS